MSIFDSGSIRAATCMVLLVAVSSCTRVAELAQDRADRAAYGNIRGAQQRAFGQADPFSIDPEVDAEARRLLEASLEVPDPDTISLAEALGIAMVNSRSYQTRKESLYIQALNLTEVQKDFNWNYSAFADASTEMTRFEDGTVDSFGDNGVDASVGAGMTRLLASGGRVTLGFTQNMLQYFTNPDASSENNVLSLNIVQPLLNGFGPLVTKEPLRQAERSMVYAVREFKRFRQDFVIDIASQYYSTLRSRDRLLNEQKNYESTLVNRKQTEAYAKAGRIADFEAAQARQSELNAADRLTSANADYQRALDDLRFTLGIPVELPVEPDPAELDQLTQRGLVRLEIELQDALGHAVSNRLDLINRRQRVEDRERALEISTREFLPDLDVSYNVQKRFDSSGGEDLNQNLGVSLDLPFDWTEDRNRYRVAQISMAREQRQLEADEDDVILTVRDLWRVLERNQSVYQNRLLSVELAERRVENTQLLLKQGKALTRDLLDAQDDLLSSRNALTAALVDYTINRLRFWNAIERFEIDAKGMWNEVSAKNNDGTAE